MRSSPEAGAVTLAEYRTVEDLPAAARALLDGDFFSTALWYRDVITYGMPPDARAILLVFADDAGIAAVFPMQVMGSKAASLTTPYTAQWRPLLSATMDAKRNLAVGRAFSDWCHGFGAVRLEAMDAADAESLCAVTRGLAKLPFDHFGNWHISARDGWSAYIAARPGHVREAVRRKTKKLLESGASLEIIFRAADIERGIAAYEAVYARSWKAAEPFPLFNPALMRSCAAAGALRLGLLTKAEHVLAAQIWVVRGPWAAVLKLAHDEAARAESPGTVLTAFMIEHLLVRDGVTELDFGRGDDAYKQSWTSERRQRLGLVLANTRTVRGAAMTARHFAGAALRRWRAFSKSPAPKA